jgi:RNA polymerase sigma factor (sigma-70 family)
MYFDSPFMSPADSSKTTPTGEISALEMLVPLAVEELEREQADGPSINRLASELLRILERYIEARGWGIDDPESTASEVLATVLSRLSHYDAAAGSLIGWAIGTARHIIWQQLRQKEARENPAETQYDISHREKLHLQKRLSADKRADLLDSILLWPDDDHRLLHLLLVEKMDASEVAGILHLSPAAVRKKKERLLKKLHGVLLDPTPTPIHSK